MLIYVNFSINQFTSVTPFSFPSQENFVSLLFRGGRALVTSWSQCGVRSKTPAVTKTLILRLRVKSMPENRRINSKFFSKD